MKALSQQYPVKVMCRVLGVSASSYYAWLKRPPSVRSQARVKLEVIVKAAHVLTRETYGYKRLHAELIHQKHAISLYQVRHIRQTLGLRCKQVKKFKATTNSAHDLPVAENLLDQTFEPTRPHEAWVSDITY